MSTLEIKKELHDIIDNSDATSIENFYEIIKNYFSLKNDDLMIQQSEEDIEFGNVLSHQEVKEIVSNWK
jgi:predicted transcriptional regulator